MSWLCCWGLGRFLFTKPLGLNPNVIELNELKTRVSFFLKLDNGKYCPWISLNFRNMTSSGDVIQIKNAIFKNIIIKLVFQKCFLSLRPNTPCLFDAWNPCCHSLCLVNSFLRIAAPWRHTWRHRFVIIFPYIPISMGSTSCGPISKRKISSFSAHWAFSD